jgi:hypothetical protein
MSNFNKVKTFMKPLVKKLEQNLLLALKKLTTLDMT